MSQPLVYIDTSAVRPGKLEELRAAIAELASFVEENEPGLVSYSAYFDESETRMSVVHVHADAASLDFHLETAGPLFQRFAELVTLSSIDVYGEPSETALGQLREKLRTLGAGDVVVHAPHAGFVRAVADAAAGKR
jgi:quinol monooxygenase YgiN